MQATDRQGNALSAGRPRPSVDSRRAWLMSASLFTALVLLGGFYLVLNQAMARAHQHWSQATRAANSVTLEGCALGNSGGACDSRSTQAVALSTGVRSGLSSTGR